MIWIFMEGARVYINSVAKLVFVTPWTRSKNITDYPEI